jgi:hypothetical protein
MEIDMENPQTLSNQPDSGPAGGDEPLSFNEGADQLEGLLDPSDEDQSKPTEPTDEDATDLEEVDAPEGEEDSDTEVDEEAEESDETDEEDDQEDTEGLVFDDNLVVEIDGEQTTLGNVVDERVQKRVSDFQADYTRKTQQVAEERKIIDTQADRLMQTAEQIKQQREDFLSYQAMFAPEAPDLGLVETDPIKYQQEKAYYDEWQTQYNNYVQESRAIQAEQQKEQQAQQQQYVAAQTKKLGEIMPELATKEGIQKFKQELEKDFIPHYGYSLEDLNSITDVRFAPLARDAMAYRRLQEKAPEAKKKLEGKPKMLKGKARASTKSKKVSAHKAKNDRLAKFGDLESAVSVIADFVD